MKRHLIAVPRMPRLSRGLTLVELLVAFAIAALLVVSAAPYFADYGANSRLRESGNTVYAEAMAARSEAIKRNRVVRLSTSGSAVQVIDLTDPANPVVLRTRALADGVTLDTATIDFGSQGWPTNLTAVAINLSSTNVTCSADYRCPGLRVEAGGAIRLCANQLDSCS
jgi:type IV fimbrial biogenesis protein FimT